MTGKKMNMHDIRIKVDTERTLGNVSPDIYGHFVEHFHRCVYGGIFDPGSPFSNEMGFRADVIKAMQHIRVPHLRWPGGCFVSDYHWQNGVGANRRPMYDRAWRVEEPNTFGTDEFMAFCRLVGTKPYICGNAGTGTAEEMANWLEYCNGPATCGYGQLRSNNGYSQPYDVEYFSIGNENYTVGEIGARKPDEFARIVRETAKLLRRISPHVKILAPTVQSLEWNTELLREAAPFIDYISIHGYFSQPHRQQRSYEWDVASAERAERRMLWAGALLKTVLPFVASPKPIRVAFDEWNLKLWAHIHPNELDPQYEIRDTNDDNSLYTMRDALFTAGFLNAAQRQCRTVTLASFSPLVNVCGAIYVDEKGIVLRPTYHVFDLYVNHTGNEALDTWTESPTFAVPEAPDLSQVPFIDASASINRSGQVVSVAVVNRNREEDAVCTFQLYGVTPRHITHLFLGAENVDDYNDTTQPDTVKIVSESVSVNENIQLLLPAHSVNIVKIGY